MIARGSVLSVDGGVVQAVLPAAAVGKGVRIRCGARTLCGSVAAVCGSRASIALHDRDDGIARGDEVWTDDSIPSVPMGLSVLGRAFNARGEPIDRKSALTRALRKIETRAPSPAQRRPVRDPLWTGIAAIDGLLTFGRGARLGIFGAPGTGKSTLLHAIAGSCDADAIVIGLAGERGREAEEWVRVAPAHATVYCATSDCPAPERILAARAAMAQACVLRDRGLDVVLFLDSFARLGAALREVALAAGERAGRGGYPPRVFSELAAFAETAGRSERGSITLLASVLSDGEERDPLSETARALLDGHVQLSPELAGAGKFPAIDVLASVSRTMDLVAGEEHCRVAALIRSALAELARTKEMRAAGIAPTGDGIARALSAEAAIETFMHGVQPGNPETTRALLRELASSLETQAWTSLTV